MTASCPQRWAGHRGDGPEPGRGPAASHRSVGGACGGAEGEEGKEEAPGSPDRQAATGLQQHHGNSKTTPGMTGSKVTLKIFPSTE